jgi:hypothetical protein
LLPTGLLLFRLFEKFPRPEHSAGERMLSIGINNLLLSS